MNVRSITLTETPVLLSSDPIEIAVVGVHNDRPSQRDWIKIWGARSTAPDPATDAPDYQFAAGHGATQWSPFLVVGGDVYVAATEDPDTAATPPGGNVRANISYVAA